MGKRPSKQVEMNIQKGFHKQRQGGWSSSFHEIH